MHQNSFISLEKPLEEPLEEINGMLEEAILLRSYPKESVMVIRYSFCCSDGKVSVCQAGDLGSIPGLGRSPGEGNGYPLQYSGLENSMDRGACRLQSLRSQRVGHD